MDILYDYYWIASQEICQKYCKNQLFIKMILKDFESGFLKDFYTKCIPILLIIVVLSSCEKKQDKVNVLLSQMTLEEKCGPLI